MRTKQRKPSECQPAAEQVEQLGSQGDDQPRAADRTGSQTYDSKPENKWRRGRHDHIRASLRMLFFVRKDSAQEYKAAPPPEHS